MKKLILPAAALALLASGGAFAQTSPLSDSIAVSAEVTEACTSLTATDVDFGAAPAQDAEDDATSTITVNCATGTPYTIEINYGLNALGTIRRVENPSNGGLFMDYAIFQPGGFTTPWGMEADGADYSGTGTGSADPLTANFRLYRLSTSEPAVYSDIVDVFLNF